MPHISENVPDLKSSKGGLRADAKSHSPIVHPVHDSKGDPMCYIISYQGGGFVILSGDKRLPPILAFSDKNQFPLNKEFPEGLKGWFFDTKELIRVTRESGQEQDESIKISWEDENILRQIYGGSDPSLKIITPQDCTGMPIPCERQRDFINGLLVGAEWGQGNGYNDALPNMGCTWDPQGNPFTGCVATAVA